MVFEESGTFQFIDGEVHIYGKLRPFSQLEPMMCNVAFFSRHVGGAGDFRRFIASITDVAGDVFALRISSTSVNC